MGSGSWSKASYTNYAAANVSDSINDTFKYRGFAPQNTTASYNKAARKANIVSDYQMKVGVRECRDSEEHPNTTPIIIAFDVTGSMGRIPHMMVKDLLPTLMNQLKEVGVPDPELLFMGIGDHVGDHAPIQVTQFESDTDKICDALTSLYLEGGGWGNGVESYLMAWIAAGYHTETDSWYKRHKKGFLFTIGDEGNHKSVPSSALVRYMGYEAGCPDLSAAEALAKAKEQYNVFHIHVNDGYNAFRQDWHESLGDHVIRCESKDLNKVIAETIHKYMDVAAQPAESKPENNSGENKEQYNY